MSGLEVYRCIVEDGIGLPGKGSPLACLVKYNTRPSRKLGPSTQQITEVLLPEKSWFYCSHPLSMLDWYELAQ